jgi:6-pyruvoyltetrahydropterin/6-carboxytetrahydropterin synthase
MATHSTNLPYSDGLTDMLTVIGKQFTFEAAHNLPEHEGKCRGVHGHSYTVEVRVSGEPERSMHVSNSGMVVDFGDLSTIWKNEIEPSLDHQFLNESIGREYLPPTAENIARNIFDWFDAITSFGDQGRLGVTVWETATSYARVGLV